MNNIEELQPNHQQEIEQVLVEEEELELDNNNNINYQNNLQQNNIEIMQQYHQATPYSDPFGGNFVGSSGGGRAGMVFPDLTPPPPIPPHQNLLPWELPQVVHTYHPQINHLDPYFFPSSSSNNSYGGAGGGGGGGGGGGLFSHHRRPLSSSNHNLQFAYEGSSSDHLRLLSDALGPMVHHQPGSAPFGLQAELNKMTAQEIMDAKALAASKSHSEAERRRRERINNHLAKLRSLLPSTTKTDKASLLAEVIQHVKELRRQTSIIAETSVVPTESDELTVDAASDEQDGKFIIKASLCCDDRNDLLPDLIKALKTLRLRTLKAEITTLGGRVKNVLFVTHEPNNNNISDHDDNNNDNDNNNHDEEDVPSSQCSISSIQEALKAVMEKSGGGDESASGNPKRQRTTNITIS